MDIKQLIQVGAMLAGLAVSSGQLPQILRTVQIAQLKLIKASQTSSWGKAMLLRPNAQSSAGRPETKRYQQ